MSPLTSQWIHSNPVSMVLALWKRHLRSQLILALRLKGHKHLTNSSNVACAPSCDSLFSNRPKSCCWDPQGKMRDLTNAVGSSKSDHDTKHFLFLLVPRVWNAETHTEWTKKTQIRSFIALHGASFSGAYVKKMSGHQGPKKWPRYPSTQSTINGTTEKASREAVPLQTKLHILKAQRFRAPCRSWIASLLGVLDFIFFNSWYVFQLSGRIFSSLKAEGEGFHLWEWVFQRLGALWSFLSRSSLVAI